MGKGGDLLRRVHLLEVASTYDKRMIGDFLTPSERPLMLGVFECLP